MKYTNKYGYSKLIEEWLKNDEYDYDANTISCTTLLLPPRIYALKVLNNDKLEIDVDSLIPSKIGTAIHQSIEQVNLPNHIKEIRLKTIVDGMVITGKFDDMEKLEDGTYNLCDNKTTSTYTYINNSKIEDYIIQLSVYRFLAYRNGYIVNEKANINYIFTDWRKADIGKIKGYPESRIKDNNPILLWDIERTEKWIKERIKLFKNALIELPLCDDKDLWINPKTGKSNRCNQYCVCRPFCEQAKQMFKDEDFELD